MLISTPPRKKSSPPAPTVAQLTKTTRASTKTSSLIPTLMWPKSMTRHTRAVGVTRRWPMGTMGKAARMRERRNPRRRRSKQQSDGQVKRDLEKVSESALRRRWGTWMPGKSWRPRPHPFVSYAMNIPLKNQIANKGSQKCQLRKHLWGPTPAINPT